MLSEAFLISSANDAPDQLTMALQTVKTIDTEAADVYEEFIERADAAERACRETGIQILGQYKLTDALPANLNPDEATNTLLLIFQFYARIKTASSHATFSAAEEDVNFMSFSKVEIFCRDFKVIPRLLTREELKMLWGDIARVHVLAGRGTFTVIDFDEFKDLIIRMSLWAYHKPGLKKLIITLEGFMPRNAQILQSFCHYLRLPDVQFINNFIRTKGRQTQGELNYRSKGETNLRTRLEVRADTDARKLSQVKAGAGNAGAKSTAKTPGKGKKLNIFGELEYEERHLRGANPKNVVRSQPLPNSMAAKGVQFSPEKKSLLPASLEEKLHPSDSSALLLLMKKVGDDDDDEDNNFGLDSPRDASAKKPIQTPSTASSKQQKKPGSAIGMDDDSEDDDDYSKPSKKSGGSARKTKPGISSPQYHFNAPDERDDDDDDNLSVASSVLSVFHDSSLEALKAAYETDYDSRLAKQELSKYCYVPPVANSTDFLPTKGPVVDLGLLQGGAKVTVQFRVSNGCGDDIFLDAVARDFQAVDTHISTFSRMLIPGLPRHVCVTFTVPKHNCRVLGHVDVLCMAPRHAPISTQAGRTSAAVNTFRSQSGNGGACMISCPVFYRVDCVAHRDVFPVCTAGSLRPLLSRSSRRTNSGTGTRASTASNVVSNSRMGTASGTNRSDWDTTFMVQRLAVTPAARPVSPLTLSRPNTAATLSNSLNANIKTTSNSAPLGSLERWPSGRFTTLTELPSTRTGQQITPHLAESAAAGSSPLVPRTLERQRSIPRPQSPVPPSIGGALTLSARLQLQRTSSASGAMVWSHSNSRPNMETEFVDDGIRYFDVSTPISPASPMSHSNQARTPKNNLQSNRSRSRLLDNLNQTAPL